jgi:hypothetical protein
MRTVRTRTLSSRASLVPSFCLFLVVGLAIAVECQQLSRTVHGVETRQRASTSSPSLPTPLPRPATIQPSGLAPEWKPGFQWHYRWSDPRGSGTYIRAISGEEILDGVPHYVMQTGNRSIYWGKADLTWLMEQVNGEVESQAVPAYQKFAWPLVPGKTWVARYHWAHPGEPKTEERVRRHRVAGLESVQVPSGTFQALRVLVTDAPTGKKVGEYWYSPETRWLVKERLYVAQGVRERELIYASLWPKAPAR